MQKLADEELIARWRAGEGSAGNELARRHYQGVLRFFEVRATAAAPDLTQRTFAAVAAALPRFEGRGTFRAFVFGVARKQLLMFLRDREPSTSFDAETEEAVQPGLTTLLTRRKEQQLLLRALTTLPLDQQIALGLFYWDGMNTAEIGEVLEIPSSTVRSRLAKAREILRGRIERLGRPGRIRDALLGDLEGWARALPRPPRTSRAR